MTILRRWGPWALVVAVAVAALAVGLHRGGGRPSLDSRVQQIAGQVRCPTCHGESAAQSGAAPAVEIRDQIRADLQKGETQDQILSSIVAAYGPGILERPQAKGIGLLVWVLPVIGVVLGGAVVLLVLGRWRRSDRVPAPAVASPVGVASSVGFAAAPVAPLPVAASPVAASEPVAASAVAVTEPVTASGPPPRRRRSRPKVAVACAGAALVAAGASWAVVAFSGARLPGQGITGQALGGEQLAAHLQAAHTDEGKGDAPGAVEEYQKVLASDPDQVEALSGEGWLLAETGQPALLSQGLSLLVRAEHVQPDYPPAHVYRGLALFGEGDYADSIPELQWYLAHDPDPKLAPAIQKSLDQAETKAKAASAAAG